MIGKAVPYCLHSFFLRVYINIFAFGKIMSSWINMTNSTTEQKYWEISRQAYFFIHEVIHTHFITGMLSGEKNKKTPKPLILENFYNTLQRLEELQLVIKKETSLNLTVHGFTYYNYRHWVNLAKSYLVIS